MTISALDDIGRVRTATTDGVLRRYTLTSPGATVYVADGARSTTPHAVGASYVFVTSPSAQADANPAKWADTITKLVGELIG